MQPETITLILNIIFYVLIGLIAIKMIIGLFRGTWKSLNSFIITMGCYAAIIFLNGTFTDLAYGMNLSGLGISFNLSGQMINVSYLGQCIRDSIIVLAGENIDLSANSQIFTICDGLAKSMLSFFVFIINFILTAFIIAPLLSLIFYHSAFKFIVGRKNAKKRNAGLRLGGFFISGVKAIVTCALFIMPFSALATQVSTIVDEYNFTNEDATNFTNYTEAYSSSALAKLMTSMEVNGSGIDVGFTSYITTAKIGRDTTSFVDELNVLVNIACDGVEEGVFNLNNMTVDFASLIGKQFVTRTLQRLASSKLVTTLLPVAISIVINLDSIKNYIDLSQADIDWYAIDWSDELTAISDIYGCFYDTGIIDRFVISQEEIDDFMISRDNYESMHNAFMGLKKSEVLSEVMPYVLSSFATSINNGESEFAGVFPSDVDSYKQIDLGEELSCFYDAIMTLSDLCSYSPLGRNLKIADFKDPTALQSQIDFIISSDAVYGSDEITVKDGSNIAIRTVDIFNGVYDNDKEIYSGLLDSKLLMDNVGAMLKIISNVEEVKKFGIGDAIDEVSQLLTTKSDWVAEIDNLLGIMPIIYNNDKIDLETIDIFDEEQINELIKIKPYINNSIIVKKVAQPLFTNIMNESGTELPFGLSTDSFNFDCERLGDELCDLLLILPKIGKLQKSLQNNGTEAIFDSDGFNIDSIEEALLTIYNSKLLNNTAEANTLSNFEIVLLNIFKDPAFADLGIEVDEDLMIKIRNNSATRSDGWVNEINAICQALRELQNSSSLQTLINKFSNNENISINDVDGDQFYLVLSTFDSSLLIHHSLGNVLNNLLRQSMEELHINIDFNCVEDWSIEFDHLRDIINIVNDMNEKGFDLNNINLSSLDYEYTATVDGIEVTKTGVDDLGDVIKSVYQLQCLQNRMVDGEIVQDDEYFGQFVYNNLTKNFFATYINEKNESSVINDHLLIISITNSDNTISNVKVPLNDSEYVEWGDEEGNNGEIDNLINLIKYVYSDTTEIDSNNDGITDSIEKTFWNVDEEGNLVGIDFNKCLNDSQKTHELMTRVDKIFIFRTILGEIVNQTLTDASSSLAIEGIDLSLINVGLFKNDLVIDFDKGTIVTREQEIAAREAEINDLIAVYDNILTINNALYDEETNSWDLSIDNINGETDTLHDLLSNLATSNLFNRVIDGKDRTFFQDLMRFILKSSTLAEMMVNDSSNADSFALNAVKAVRNFSPTDNNWIDSTSNGEGEITKFINALKNITDSSVAAIFKDGANVNEELMNIEGADISNLIKSVSKSEILNYQNSLGNILNNQIGSAFSYEDTGLYVQFDKVTDWDSEAEAIGTLIDSIKSLNDGSGTFNLNIDIATVDSNSLASVLNSLNSLQAVQNATDEFGTALEDNFGSFVYNKVTKQAFGDYINSANQSQIMSDHYLKTNPDSTWSNEVQNLKLVVDLIQSKDSFNNYRYLSLSSDNTYELDISKITSNKENFNDLLEQLNQLYIHRTLFASLISDSLTDATVISIDGLDLNKINTTLFLNEYNYKSDLKEVNNRQEEIDSRSLEIEKLSEIFGLLLDLQSEFTNIVLSNLVDSSGNSTATLDDIFILLENLHDSRMFNKDVNGSSFFEDTIKLFLVKSSLSSMMKPNESTEDDPYALSAVVSIDDKGLSWKDNSTTLGELSLMKSAIVKAGSAGSLFEETSSSDLSSIEPETIGAVIDSFSKSNVFNYNNALANVLNRKVAPNFDGTGLEIDFTNVGREENTRVEEWGQEANNISNLLSALKNMNNGSISFDFSFNSFTDAQLDSLQGVLDSLHNLLVVQKTPRTDGDDNYGYFIYYNVTSKVFSTYIDSENLPSIKADHNIDSSSYVFNESYNVAWNNNTYSIGGIDTLVQGDNQHIVDLLRFAVSNLLDSSGNFDSSKVNDLSISDLDNLLSKMNDVFAFRTIISKIIKSNLTTSGSAFVSMNDNVYVDLFNFEYNFLNESLPGSGQQREVNNREEELNSRRNELSLLIDILDHIEELNNRIGSASDLNGIDSADISGITSTLMLLHDSRMFNSAKVKAAGHQTLFEDVVKKIMDITTLSNMVYDSSYDLDSSSNPIGVNAKVYNLINDVSNSVDGLSWTKGATTTSELGDSVLGKFDSLLIKLTSLGIGDVDQINSLSSENVSLMLNGLNECYLSHDAVSNLTESVLTSTINIDSYILPDTPAVDGHYIDKTYSNFESRVSNWALDIEKLCSLYDSASNLNSIDGSSGSVQSNIFESTIPYIGQLQTLTNQRADIIFSIFKKASIEGYISEYRYSANTDSDLRRRDLIKYLIDSNISTNDDWIKESQALDNLSNALLNNRSLDFDVDNTNSISGDTIYDVMSVGYTYDADLITTEYEEKYDRYYLASELITSFVTDTALKTDPSIEAKLVLRDGVSGDKYSYKGLNIFEARGMKGLINYTKCLKEYYDAISSSVINPEFTYDTWKSNILASAYLIGNNDAIDISSSEKFYYLGDNNYNAITAMALYSSLSSDKTNDIDSLINNTNSAIDVYNLMNGTTYDHIPAISRWEPNEGESFYELTQSSLLVSLESLYTTRQEILS